MTIIHIDAIYRNGVLQLQTALELPEDTHVQLQITPVSSPEGSKKSLFGAFPELGQLSDADFEQAKQAWEQSIERQATSLNESR